MNRESREHFEQLPDDTKNSCKEQAELTRTIAKRNRLWRGREVRSVGAASQSDQCNLFPIPLRPVLLHPLSLSRTGRWPFTVSTTYSLRAVTVCHRSKMYQRWPRPRCCHARPRRSRHEAYTHYRALRLISTLPDSTTKLWGRP